MPSAAIVQPCSGCYPPRPVDSSRRGGISFVVGAAAGTISGYFGGWIDAAIGRVTDTIMAFPLFVLAMGIVAAAGNTVANIVYATAVINIPTYVRVARAEVLVRREAPFIQAARLAGNGPARVLAFHLFPNVLRL